MPKEFYSQKDIQSDSMRGVISPDGLNLRVEYLTEEKAHERFQMFPLPEFFPSFEDLQKRQLSVDWESGPPSIQTYSRLLEGLSTYISLQYPGFDVYIPIKNYAERSHGQPEDARYQFVPVVHFLGEIKENATEYKEKSRENWTGSFSNVVMIGPEQHFLFTKNSAPLFPQNDGIPSMLMFPVLDLDIDASGNPEKDLHEVSEHLINHGFSGWLIQSGDAPHGGYHYLADFMMPYDPFMWQSLGKLMFVLTSKKQTDLLALATSIEHADSLKGAQEIAKEILNMEQIRKRSWPQSSVDYRFCAHQIDAGMSKLRTLQAKGYENVPRIIAQIC
jgi:hypothetical protein